MIPKLSIIVVAYKAEDELFGCLKSLHAAKFKPPFEIIVVDNNEKSGLGPRIQRRFPKVKYIKSPGNIGFGRGNNLGVAKAKGEYLFFLNPDTKVLAGTLRKLVNFLAKNPKAGVVAPVLLNEKGTPYRQIGSQILTPIRAIFGLSFLNKIFPSNPISRRYWFSYDLTAGPLEVGVVPGSAMLMRRKVFKKIGCFDKKFFLFFEESDLCKRLQKRGYKCYLLGDAKIIHLWQRSTPQSEKIRKIFSQSRFYYFRKHYGLFWAAVVHLVTSFSKWYAILLATVILGAFLRFYRLSDYVVFHGELGHNYLAIKNFILLKQIPLLGPPTSHPWLSFGPLFYWLFGPILALSGFNPVAGSYFFATIGTVLIFLNFCVVRKFFREKAAAVSSFLIAISPAWLSLTRDSRFFSLSAFFFYPFLYFLLEKRLFWAGFFLGVMFNFHLSPIILLLPTAIYIYFNRKKFPPRGPLVGIVGFVIPNLPFLIYNATHKFEMLINLITWIPYRIAGFIGLYPKNTATPEVLKSNLFSLYDFFAKMFVADKGAVSLAVFLVTLAFILVRFYRETRQKQKDWPLYLLILFFIFGYLGIFIHGDPPRHYYLPIYPLPIIFFSIFISEILTKGSRKYLVLFILGGFLFLNLRYYFSNSWFYRSQAVESDMGFVPYKLQLVVAQTIIGDANGQKYSLARVGYGDKFEGNYAQNYQYLLWWKGNEPVDNAKTKYTIYETKLPAKILGKIIYQKDGLAILKDQNGK